MNNFSNSDKLFKVLAKKNTHFIGVVCLVLSQQSRFYQTNHFHIWSAEI